MMNVIGGDCLGLALLLHSCCLRRDFPKVNSGSCAAFGYRGDRGSPPELGGENRVSRRGA
eukprot:scaffold3341_cov95-Skeletonema_marinoi.AAC.1